MASWCWLLAEGFSSLPRGFPFRIPPPKYPPGMGIGFPQSEPSRRAWWKSQCLLWPGFGSFTVMSAVSYRLPWSALLSVREDYPNIRMPSWELTSEWFFAFMMASFRFNKAYFAYTLKPSWWNWWKPKLGVPSYNEICMDPWRKCKNDGESGKVRSEQCVCQEGRGAWGGYRSSMPCWPFGRTWVFFPFHNIRSLAGNTCLNVVIFFLSLSPVQFKWHTRFWEVVRKGG